MDLFAYQMTDGELNGVSSLALAHIGDAVFELMVRTRLMHDGAETAGALHARTVKMVSAKAQARFAERLLPHLTERETGVFKRGRNAKISDIHRASGEEEYHTATALETLFGWLYLKQEKARLNELFELILEENDGA